MKIVQLLPSMSFGDAVSNDAAAIQQMIRESGMETVLYSRHIDSRLPALSRLHRGSHEPAGAAAEGEKGHAVSQHHSPAFF